MDGMRDISRATHTAETIQALDPALKAWLAASRFTGPAQEWLLHVFRPIALDIGKIPTSSDPESMNQECALGVSLIRLFALAQILGRRRMVRLSHELKNAGLPHETKVLLTLLITLSHIKTRQLDGHFDHDSPFIAPAKRLFAEYKQDLTSAMRMGVRKAAAFSRVAARRLARPFTSKNGGPC